MATTDEIVAAVETAETAIGEALGTLVTETGVAIESIELVDATTEPPTVKVNVALAPSEDPAPDAAAAPSTFGEHFGVA